MKLFKVVCHNLGKSGLTLGSKEYVVIAEHPSEACAKVQAQVGYDRVCRLVAVELTDLTNGVYNV